MTRALLVLWLCLLVQLEPGHVRRVIDGDTGTLWNVGIQTEVRFRVLGVDTPERGEPGFEEARQGLATWLARGPFTFHVCKYDSFGRYLAWVSRGTDSLHVALVNARLGVRAP